jgi:hypothetical protein
MSEFVIILGAGSSKAAGAPLMNEFIERSERKFRPKAGIPGRFDGVFDAISHLQRVHSKFDLDLFNLGACPRNHFLTGVKNIHDS